MLEWTVNRKEHIPLLTNWNYSHWEYKVPNFNFEVLKNLAFGWKLVQVWSCCEIKYFQGGWNSPFWNAKQLPHSQNNCFKYETGYFDFKMFIFRIFVSLNLSPLSLEKPISSIKWYISQCSPSSQSILSITILSLYVDFIYIRDTTLHRIVWTFR